MQRVLMVLVLGLFAVHANSQDLDALSGNPVVEGYLACILKYAQQAISWDASPGDIADAAFVTCLPREEGLKKSIKRNLEVDDKGAQEYLDRLNNHIRRSAIKLIIEGRNKAKSESSAPS